LEEASLDDNRPYLKKTGMICSHCHKEIRGKMFNLGNRFFDEYCWSLRFILDAQEAEGKRLNELKKRMETDQG
jgi:hypothetical protein